MLRICVVDDEDLVRVTLSDDLSEMGYQVKAFASPEKAFKAMEEEFFHVVISDLKMPGTDGIQFMKKVKKFYPQTSFIMITAFGTVESAVKAMKAGAYDFITKPFQPEAIQLLLKKLEERYKLLEENLRLRSQIAAQKVLPRIIGKSTKMQEIMELIQIVAPSDSNVLITGETGTGKELIAEAIHAMSPRREKQLVKVSCAVLSSQLLESELFGHMKGAFTGAVSNKIGRFELANHGTIFLDEVDDIPVELQVKLLRVIQQKEIERVGDPRPIRLDVRVIAATKVDLYQKVKEGKFRQDLFYRLNVVPIRLPPLRERKEDIPLLLRHFAKKYRPENPMRFTQKTMDNLMNQPWEGNIRELENLVERLSIVCQCDPITPACLPAQYLGNPASQKEYQLSLPERMARYECEIIQSALQQCKGNIRWAAQTLKVPYSTLRSKMEKYGLA